MFHVKQSEQPLLVTPRLTLQTLPTLYIFCPVQNFSYLYPGSQPWQEYPANGICLVDGDPVAVLAWRDICLTQCGRGYGLFTVQLAALEYVNLEFDYWKQRVWGFRYFLEEEL